MASASDSDVVNSPANVIPAAELAAMNDRVRLAQFNAMYRQGRITNLASPIIAAIVCYLLLGEIGGQRTVGWLALVVAASVARIIVHQRFERATTVRGTVTPSEQRQFLLAICFSGLIWGGGMVFLFPLGNLALQAFVIVVVLGMGAGATAAFGPYFPALASYLVPLTVPIATILLLQQTAMHIAFGIFGWVFLGVLLLLGLASHRNFAASFRLEFENAYLMHDLEHAQRRLDDAIDSMSEAFALFDADDRLILANERLRRLLPQLQGRATLGVTYDDFVGLLARTALTGAPTAHLDAWIEDFKRRHRHTDEPFEVELAGGLWLRVGEQPTRDGGVVTIMTDVTSIRLDQQQLAEKTGLLQATLEGMGEGILVLDRARRVVLVNHQFLKLVELPADVVAPGAPFEELSCQLVPNRGEDLPGGDGSRSRSLDDLFAAGVAFQFDHQRPSGSRLLVRANPLADNDWVLLLTDVTAERRAIAALEESEDRYRQLVDGSPDLISIHQDGRFLFVNPAGARLLGLASPEALIGRRVLEFIHPDHHDYLRESAPGIAAGGASDTFYEFRALRADGSQFEAEGISLEFSHREEPAILGIVRDITLRKLAQAQLVQTSKLATLGEMAAGIMHELNQPLNLIRMAADSSLILMEEGKTDRDFERQQFERISANAVRMADIVSHMATFSRREDRVDSREPIDPFSCVRAAVSLVSDQYARDNVTIDIALPDESCLVYGNSIRLEQVILNLLTNSRDALVLEQVDPRSGRPVKAARVGRIHVSAQYESRDAGDARRPNRQVVIRVDDNGGGIPAGALERVFDPFFTTKRTGQGTGLGLAIGYNIVNSMGGRIVAANRAEGASFEIWLPVAERLDAGDCAVGAEAHVAPARPQAKSSEKL